jgi:hypothetical protein
MMYNDDKSSNLSLLICLALEETSQQARKVKDTEKVTDPVLCQTATGAVSCEEAVFQMTLLLRGEGVRYGGLIPFNTREGVFLWTAIAEGGA